MAVALGIGLLLVLIEGAEVARAQALSIQGQRQASADLARGAGLLAGALTAVAGVIVVLPARALIVAGTLMLSVAGLQWLVASALRLSAPASAGTEPATAAPFAALLAGGGEVLVVTTALVAVLGSADAPGPDRAHLVIWPAAALVALLLAGFGGRLSRRAPRLPASRAAKAALAVALTAAAGAAAASPDGLSSSRWWPALAVVVAVTAPGVLLLRRQATGLPWPGPATTSVWARFLCGEAAITWLAGVVLTAAGPQIGPGREPALLGLLVGLVLFSIAAEPAGRLPGFLTHPRQKGISHAAGPTG